MVPAALTQCASRSSSQRWVVQVMRPTEEEKEEQQQPAREEQRRRQLQLESATLASMVRVHHQLCVPRAPLRTTPAELPSW